MPIISDPTAQNREPLWSAFIFYCFLILNMMNIPKLLLKNINISIWGSEWWVLCHPPHVRLSDPGSWLLIMQTRISQVLSSRQNRTELWGQTEKKSSEQKFLSSENGIYRIPGLFPITWNWPLSSLSWHPCLEDHLPNWLWYCVACAERIFWINHHKISAGLSAIHMEQKVNLDSYVSVRKKKIWTWGAQILKKNETERCEYCFPNCSQSLNRSLNGVGRQPDELN